MATRAEQEVIIRWDEEEKLVHVYSASPIIWRRLAKAGWAIERETHAKFTGERTGIFYMPIPLARFRFGLKRERTAAQVAAAQKGGFGARRPAVAVAPDESTGRQ